VDAWRMGEIVRPVGGRIRDVICCRPARWVQTQNVAGALRNLVIGTRRITADAEPADHAAVLIQRQASAKENQAACNLVLPAALACRWRKKAGVEQVRLTEAVQ